MTNTGVETLAGTEIQDELFPELGQETIAKAPGAKKGKSAVTVTVNNAQLAQTGFLKLEQIQKELNAVLFERENEIKSILLGLITNKHVLFLGDPGTGKSMLAVELSKHIGGANYFQWLLNRTSDPSELLGPISVKAMEKDQYTRKPSGKLPEAHIAFLDEIFKSNSATLNILLSALNEGIWYNDGVPMPIPLKLAIGASNEFPEDEELGAFFDRFIFRHWVDYVGDAQNQAMMLKAAVARRMGLNNTQRTVITLDEIEAVQQAVTQVVVPDAAIHDLQKLLLELKKKDINVSDRRIVTCLHVMQANAALEGRTSVDGDDMEHLAYVLWERQEDITEIQSIVTKMMNPFKDKVNTAYNEAVKTKNDIMNTSDKTDRANKAIDGRNVLDKIAKKIDAVIKDAAKQGRDTKEFMKKKAAVVGMMDEIVQVCLFNVSNDSSADPDELPF